MLKLLYYKHEIKLTMKSNTLFKLFIILIISFILRLWFLDKPEGLWNDEYVSWFIASEKSISSFLKDAFNNCHTPLYYIYLKFWMMLFKDCDFSLRISSVIPSILTVITMFFCGKEIKNKNFGLFTAFLMAISSFSIYFAQEVRLYSLLLFFSAGSTLYFIKSVKNTNKLNVFLFILFNALITAIHTLGIIFSISSILTLLYILNKKKHFEIIKKIKNLFVYLLPFIIVVAIISPFLFTIATSNSLSQFWSSFSISKIFFTFSDYFSPIQTNIVNTPNTIITYIYNNDKINYIYIIFAIIPFIIALISVINAILKRNKIINSLLFSSLIFYIILIIIALTGKMILITKYSCEIYPALILAFCFGIISFNKKLFSYLLASIFIFLNLFYLIFSPDSAPQRTRSEGHKAVVKLLENSRLKNTDYVLLTYYDVDKFERYLKNKNQYKFYSINKFNFNYSMFNNKDYFEVIKHGKVMYKNNFMQFPNEAIMNYSQNNFISKMNKGERIGIIFLNSVSFLSNDKIQYIIRNPKEYDRTSFIFIVFSALRNTLLYSFKKDYKIDSITQVGDWTLVVFEKIN
jgi:4-amino-4-deoxy-L-arabinose transferase-like glycosyltransferase